MKLPGIYDVEDGDHLCTECGAAFGASRRRFFGREVRVCSTECQRARKTRLQKERRAAQKRALLPQQGVVV